MLGSTRNHSRARRSLLREPRTQERRSDAQLVVVGLIVGVMLAVVVANGRDADATSPFASSPDRVLAATVAIRSQGCDGTRVGTGVLVTGGEVWTAGHVVDGASSVAVDGDGPDDEFTTSVAVGLDWATVSVGSDATGALTVAPVDPPVGAAVRVAGRAGGRTAVRSAVVQDYVMGAGAADPAMVMRLDITVAPGDSGGPVVDAIGRVVGVVYASEWRDHRALVIPVSQIAAARARGLVAPTSC